MGRALSLAAALAMAASVLSLPLSARASDRSLPMHFDLRLQGPADICGTKCKAYISAVGAITADTPNDFVSFAQSRNLTGATVVLDSDGGSVHGAITLGREIRKLALDTTVGRMVDLAAPKLGSPRATFSPRANCESMCAFVLLAGVRRVVPPEAQVMVHQIWLGDRRDDPTAATYSAEDLVLVQRDIGRLARYTAEMGASIDMLDLSLRIPPWEPMHAMTRDELQTMRVATDDSVAPTGAAVATAPAAPPMQLITPVTNGVAATEISEKRWAVVDRTGGAASLARRHPLTIEGDDIGSFDLMVSCGAGSGAYDIAYLEHRHDGDRTPLPPALGKVTMLAGGQQAALKVVSSERHADPGELVTYAAGSVPAALIDGFAALGTHSLLIETTSGNIRTGIRLGNTGAQQSLPQLAASCRKAPGDRAELTVRKVGGLAAAQ
ncbi:MAG TPA: hypothetical protein VI251_06545 [Pseudolabrys sp.]|jgi:hypothetical protein